MVWTWEEIKEEWLGDSEVAYTPTELVEAFERVERFFGRDWMAKGKLLPGSGNDPKGISITLLVASLGRQLAILDKAAGADSLLRLLDSRDPQALSELQAAYLVCADLNVSIEYEPSVQVKGRVRTPDWAFATESGPATYVEVTRPGISAATARTRSLMERLAGLIDRVESPVALEVFLRREPTADELPYLEEQIVTLESETGVIERDLPAELGRLFLNATTPTRVVLDDHGEPSVPRLGIAKIP